MKSGIYTITNLINGKIYVGYSNFLYSRKTNHLSLLSNDKHSNIHLQRAVNLEGIENFRFEVLEYYSENLLVAMEHYWCTILNVHNRNFGYNILPTNPYEEHKKLSKETKDRISNGNKGKVVSEFSRNKISKVNMKPLIVLDLKSNYINSFDSIQKCAISLKLNPSTLSEKLKHNTHYKNYIIIFEKDYIIGKDYSYIIKSNKKRKNKNYAKNKKISLINMDNNEVLNFISYVDASYFLGKDRKFITRRIKRDDLIINNYKIHYENNGIVNF